MTTYFDATQEADRALLPQAQRGYQDMANIAPLVEADVIALYTDVPQPGSYEPGAPNAQVNENPGEDISTSSTGVQLRVYLKGYKVDASLADANLRLALKRTIAEVIAWRIQQRVGGEPGLQSASGDGSKSKGFRERAEDAFPVDWDRWLRPFAAGRAPWGW